METRLIIFLVISFLLIMVYPTFIERFVGPTQGGNAPPPKRVAASNTKNEIRKIVGALPSAQDAAMPLAAAPEILKTIETDLYRAVLSSRGGVVKSWTLKKYTRKVPGGKTSLLSLIPHDADTRPLALTGWDGNYTLDSRPLRLDSTHPEAEIKMIYADARGRRAEKKLRFYYDQYRVDVTLHTSDAALSKLSLGTNFGIGDWGAQYGSTVGAVSLVNHQVIRKQPTAETPELIHAGPGEPLGWMALQDKYFVAALIPKVPHTARLAIHWQAENRINTQVEVTHTPAEFVLYAGPKAYDQLTRLHAQLEEVIDFGWFISGSWLPVRMVAKPLFYILNFIYQFTYNYGIAIVLLTLLVKVAFFPLTKKSMLSMKAMSGLQPRVAEIRAKWAKDKIKMNTELMGLYKKHGINPLGGCLPMLMQIPVFIALFNVLYVTIELRQAPFMGWITDLSDKDPYYVLPVLMGITMYLQQWKQPAVTTDPVQAKMMMVLPAVYTLFSISFPSGLILYWVVNNLLTTFQQHLIQRSA